MKPKIKLIIAGAVLFVFLLLIITYISLVSSKTIIAQMDVEQGRVLVNGEIVSGTVHLSQEDVIETKEDGLATIILYESIVINLDSNTKIYLDDLAKENPTVSQIQGSVFYQVTNLFGINSYTVKSGNSVASVRGTAFSIEEDKIFVGEGEVEYELDGKRFNVLGGKAVEKINGEVNERDLSPEEKERINQLRERAVEALRNLRQKELEKHPLVLRTIKRQYQLSDEQIREGFELADKGEINLTDFEDKIPLDLKSVEKVIEITEKIKKLNSRIF